MPVFIRPPGPLAFVPQPNPLQDFGQDVSALPDLDERFQLQGGLSNLGEALARRLETPRGGLFYDPAYGTDVRAYLNDGLTPAQFLEIKGKVEAEVEKDPRVQTSTATVSYDFTSETLSISLLVTSAQGPFALVLAVTALTVQILDAGG